MVTPMPSNHNVLAQCDLLQLRNLGNTTVNWLRAVGIRSQLELAEIGPVEAYNRIRDRGFRVSRVLLYALQAALLDVHWTQLEQERKQQLVREADARLADRHTL